MGKIKTLLTALARSPVYSIGVILAIALLGFGIYFGGPWYMGGPATAIGSVFETDIVRVILSGLYIVPTVSVLLGIKYKGLRRFGTFGMTLMYFFVAILRLVSIGFTPVIWVFMLACGLISGVVYLYVSLREDEKAPDDGLL